MIVKQSNKWGWNILLSQKKFALAYVLLVMICYFLFFAKQSLNFTYADQILSLIRMIFVFMNFSLYCYMENVNLAEFICVEIILIVWVFQYSAFTVIIIVAASN